MSKLKTKKKLKKTSSKKSLKSKKNNPVKKFVKTKKPAKTKKTIQSKNSVKIKKTAKSEDIFSAKELNALTKQLKELRVSLANIVKTKKELDLVEHDTGDVIDIANQSLDKEMFFELSGNELGMLEDVDAALRRLDNGSYGICEYCKKPIKKLRIKAIPQTRYCLVCQSVNENKTNA
ncbi:MAG: TraR/DksA family transcriptional regulator [Elusimicrobia bacterium]|nr:TraR/DksA family transcriptional regulator [Elusimicrobiota bacterium]